MHDNDAIGKKAYMAINIYFYFLGVLGYVIKKILVPMDASKFSFEAANYAVGLAKMHDASVFLIHVVEIHPYYSLPYYLTAGADLMLEKEIKKLADSWFGKIEENARRQNVKASHETLLRRRSVIEAIVSYAKDKKVDLIIIGSHGATGLKRLLMGSVAKGVIEHAPCPVLLVR